MKEDSFILIIELDRYQSKAEFLKVTKKVDKEAKTDVLFKEFLKVVYNRNITEEVYETV